MRRRPAATLVVCAFPPPVWPQRLLVEYLTNRAPVMRMVRLATNDCDACLFPEGLPRIQEAAPTHPHAGQRIAGLLDVCGGRPVFPLRGVVLADSARGA